jgi:hypothetical protein
MEIGDTTGISVDNALILGWIFVLEQLGMPDLG